MKVGILRNMEIDADLVDRVRRYDRAAVESVFTEMFPAVHRMAYALTGSPDAGSAVERFVLKRAMRVLETWRDAAAPQRWFFHHTVLATRRARFRPAELKDDVLLTATSEQPDPAFVAFVRAMRGLPMQQREAFLLAHAERLGTRQMAVAMDLSVQATSLHLLSAENTLRPIAAENYEAMLTELSRRYLALTPSATISVPKLRRFVARRLWPRRIRRFLGWLILLAAFAGIGYAVWKIRPLIEF